MTTGLPEFLTAQLAEDERDADDIHDQSIDGWLGGECACDYPARVRAEVEAKRRILNEHYGFLNPHRNPDRACRQCSDRRADHDPLVNYERWVRLEPAPCLTVRLLALPYAGHEDYQEEWRP